MLEEKTSKNLGIPYVYLPDQKKFLCKNGVMFTLEEYHNGIDLNAEYERREKEDKLYDYAYAKSTGILRKKRNTDKKEEEIKKSDKNVQEESDNFKSVLGKNNTNISDTSRAHKDSDSRWLRVPSSEGTNGKSRAYNEVSNVGRADNGQIDNTRGLGRDTSIRWNTNSSKSVLVICALLAFTSVISMYISTLHTATYLKDYVEIISAWLMSASVTAYNATAFEVSVLFKSNKRYFMSVVFMFLWILVTMFSMATTVSVFYDQFNFNETQIAEENKEIDANKLALEMLQKKETDLRESIDFKKKDIEYRQSLDYATTAVRQELNKLQEELQNNLSEQQKLLSETPEVTQKITKRKESLFSFLGRIMHLEGGILEFIMSTLSAIFVNLIAPLSLTAVTELLKKEK